MGGMQAHNGVAKLSDKLFRDSGDLYGRKTTDDKLTEIRDDCRNLCKNYENNSDETDKQLSKHDEEITLLKKEIDFLKELIINGSKGKWGVYASKEEMKSQFDDFRKTQGFLKQDIDKLKSEHEAAPTGSAVVKPTVDVKPLAKIEAPKDDLDGWMNVTDLTNHIKKLSESGKKGYNKRFGVLGNINKLSLKLWLVIQANGAMVTPSLYGTDAGYVKSVIIGKTRTTVYNVEKYEKLLVEYSKDPVSVIERFDDGKGKFYAGEVAV